MHNSYWDVGFSLKYANQVHPEYHSVHFDSLKLVNKWHRFFNISLLVLTQRISTNTGRIDAV